MIAHRQHASDKLDSLYARDLMSMGVNKIYEDTRSSLNGIDRIFEAAGREEK